MNPKAVAVGLMLVGALWVYFALHSIGIGKTGIAMVQGLAAIAFVVRGVFEWRKASRQEQAMGRRGPRRAFGGCELRATLPRAELIPSMPFCRLPST